MNYKNIKFDKYLFCLFILLFSTAALATCSDPIISPKCQQFIAENNIVKYHHDLCKKPESCMCNLHDPYDRSLREYNHQTILSSYDSMVNSLNADPVVRKWFDKTNGEEPTLLDCEGVAKWTDCNAYNAYCMSRVLRVSIDEDIKKYADHINFCKNSALVKNWYIDSDRYPDLTKEQRKQKAKDKCNSHYKKFQALQGYVPYKRNQIDANKMPHTRKFFDRAVEDMSQIATLEEMNNAIDSIKIEKEQTKKTIQIKGLLYRCRRQQDNDVYNRDIETNIGKALGSCPATTFFSQEEIDALYDDWQSVELVMKNVEQTELHHNLALQEMPSSVKAILRYKVCNETHRPITKDEAFAYVKELLPSYSHHGRAALEKITEGWKVFNDQGLNKNCKRTTSDIKKDLDDLNNTLSELNGICSEMKREYAVNERIFTNVPNHILRQYVRFGSKNRFSNPGIPHDFWDQVDGNRSQYTNGDFSSSAGEYDKDFLARVMLTGKDPAGMINKNAKEQKDLELYIDGIGRSPSRRSCDTEGPLRAMDRAVKEQDKPFRERVDRAWAKLAKLNPRARAMIGMSTIQENIFKDYKYGANLGNWFDKYCAGRSGATPFKKFTLSEYQNAESEMDNFVQQKIIEIDNHLNPKLDFMKSQHLEDALKTQPMIMAEILKDDGTNRLSAQACKLIHDIYDDDEFNYRSTQIVGGIAALAGLVLMCTGVGSPAGAALLATSVALTSVEVGLLQQNMNEAQHEKACVMSNIAVGNEDIDQQLSMLPGIDGRYDDNKIGMYIAVFGLGFDAVEGVALLSKLSKVKAVKSVLNSTQVVDDAATWNKISKMVKVGLGKVEKALKNLDEVNPELASAFKANFSNLNPEQIAALGLLYRNASTAEVNKMMKFFGGATDTGMAKVLDMVAANPDTFIDSFGRLNFKLLDDASKDSNVLLAGQTSLRQIENSIDDAFEQTQSLVSNSTDKLSDLPADELNKLCGKDVQIEKFLGQGGNSEVYELSDGSVLKLSRSNGTETIENSIQKFSDGQRFFKDQGLDVIDIRRQGELVIDGKKVDALIVEKLDFSYGNKLDEFFDGFKSREAGSTDFLKHFPESQFGRGFSYSDLLKLDNASIARLNPDQKSLYDDLLKRRLAFDQFVENSSNFTKIGDFAPHHVVWDVKTGAWKIYDMTDSYKMVRLDESTGEWIETSYKNGALTERKITGYNPSKPKSFWDKFYHKDPNLSIIPEDFMDGMKSTISKNRGLASSGETNVSFKYLPDEFIKNASDGEVNFWRKLDEESHAVLNRGQKHNPLPHSGDDGSQTWVKGFDRGLRNSGNQENVNLGNHIENVFGVKLSDESLSAVNNGVKVNVTSPKFPQREVVIDPSGTYFRSRDMDLTYGPKKSRELFQYLDKSGQNIVEHLKNSNSEDLIAKIRENLTNKEIDFTIDDVIKYLEDPSDAPKIIMQDPKGFRVSLTKYWNLKTHFNIDIPE